MAKKKSSTTEKEEKVPSILAKARERQRLRSIHCEGCFAPKNTLIVKTHLEKVWFHLEICLKDDHVIVPCHYCKEKRILSMSSVALNWLSQDLDKGHKQFMLLKDQDSSKFNDLVGCDEVEEVEVDLEEWR